MYEIIVNPGSQSGNGLKLWEKIEVLFKKYGADYRVHYTKCDDSDRELFVSLCDEYKEKSESLHIVVMGGDGTVNVVLQYLPTFENIKLSVIPVGSGNDLVRDIDFKGNRAARVKHLLENPIEKSVDIGVVHCENSKGDGANMDQRFIVSTGIGYDAAVCEEVMRSKIKNALNKVGLGKLVYLVVALKQLAGLKYVTTELTLDGSDEKIKFDQFILLAAMNHRFEGGGFMFGPEAKSNDGLLEICAANGLKRMKILMIMAQATKGKHFANKGVEHYRVASYTLHSSEPLWVHTDGEIRTMADTIRVETLKEVLRLVY